VAITYFGSASTPADGGSQAGPTVAVAPPASMQVGDLVVMVSQQRVNATGAPMNVLATGGQTWNTLGQIEDDAAHIAFRVFWCLFDGTWTANPSVSVGSVTLPLSVVMHVFRPTSTDMLWAIDVAQAQAAFDAPELETESVLLDSRTTAHASTVTLGFWTTADARAWLSMSGSGWSAFTPAQYENKLANYQTSTYGRNIRTTVGVIDQVGQRQQSPLAGGRWGMVTWYEEAPSAGQPITRRRGGVPGTVPGGQRIGRGW